MPKLKQSRRNPAAEAASPTAHWHERLTQFAFVLAVALMFARGTMLESVRDTIDVNFGADAVPRGPGPAAGLVLDLLCCIPALLVLTRRLVDPEYVLLRTWSHLAFALFAAWAALSTVWSADKFVALVTGSHVVAAAALMWAMAQLVRTWLRLRIVTGACFGLLLCCVAYGLIYRFVDLPDMRRSWEREKDTILKQRGWEPGSFSAVQFERKILNGEMMGFHVSPNTYAAVLVMLTVIAAGAAIQRLASRDERGWAAAIALAAIIAIVVIRWTNSKTAMATLAWAACALGILALARAWLANHSRKAYWIALIAFALGVVAVAAHGAYHNGLFEGRFSNSLHFRWRYWVGATRVFEAHPMLGVGWSNFGNHYLTQRLPEASEEVKDPHNFLVRAFVELGIVGGALLLAWLALMWWELTRPRVPSAPPDDQPIDPQYSMTRAMLTMSAIAGLGLILNVAASVDFVESGAYAFIEICKRLLYAALVLAGGLIVAIRSTTRQELDARPAPWVLYGCLIGLGTLLLQNLIDLSLFEAGPMMLFATVAGAAGGVRGASAAPTKRLATPAFAAAALSGGALAWAAALLFVVTPVIRASAEADGADVDIRYGRTLSAAARFRSAFFHAPASNADYLFRSARALIMERANPNDVRAVLNEAIEADPTLTRAYLMRAAYEMDQSPRDAQAVRAAYDRAIALNPGDVETRLSYAADLEKLGLNADAAEQYRLALSFNDKLPLEEPERLTKDKVAEIETRIAGLSAPTTAPG